MFVTAADFVGQYQLPGKNHTPVFFTAFIEQQEKEILTDMLGITFYNDLVTGLAADPVLAKWIAIRDGVSYILYSNLTYKSPSLKEILVPYIYAMYLRETFDNVETANGVTIGKSENSETISPSTRIVRAYNRFSELVGNESNYYNTLYGYLGLNLSLYPTLDFQDVGTMNIWNL